MTFYIQQTGQFIGNGIEDKILRQHLKEQGIDGRRLSRFTLFALLGALPLKPYIRPNTAIYLGSPFNSPAKFDKMFRQLTEQNLPSPLDFMANINNAATFQLAQVLQTTGNSLFLAVNRHNFWQPLQLAMLDLMTSDAEQVLVGWVLESADKKQREGACFWLLSNVEKSAVKKLNGFFRELNIPKDREFLQLPEWLLNKLTEN